MRAKGKTSKVIWNAMYYHFITSHSRTLGKIVNSVYGDSADSL